MNKKYVAARTIAAPEKYTKVFMPKAGRKPK